MVDVSGQRFTLAALGEEVSGSILGRTYLGHEHELFQIVFDLSVPGSGRLQWPTLYTVGPG